MKLLELMFRRLLLPYFRGRGGENYVARVLRGLDPKQYVIINDLMIPSGGNTAATQIDHVVVSNFGIFCIETKALTGWIFGNAHQAHWTQVIYHFKKGFYNPLRQNYAHTQAVEALVRPIFPTALVVGFVAFPYAERLQVSGTNNVGYANDILSKIQDFKNKTLSDSDRDKICEVLRTANITDKESRKLHKTETRALKSLNGE